MYEPFGIFTVFSYRIPKGNLIGKFGIIKLAGAPFSQRKGGGMGGLTNCVYQHRIQGQGTEEYINRAHEAASAKAASQAGVSPGVLYVNPVSGLLVTRSIGGVTLTPDGFKTCESSPARACGKSTADSHQAVYSNFTSSSSQ